MLVPLAHGDTAGLREQMSATEFEQAGLHRLTPQELQALQAWLRAEYQQRSAVESGPASASSTATAEIGTEQLPKAAEPVEGATRAKILGPFSGWAGKTVFLLDNGQIWRQRIGGRYRYQADSPEVEITKGRFGYYLKVLKTGRQVGVRRLK